MNRVVNAITAVLLGIVVSFSEAQQAQKPPVPYAIQRDVLGESLGAFLANNPGCRPKAGTVAKSLLCVMTDHATYAGMPVMARTAHFYDGSLYLLMLTAPTSKCREFNLLGSLKQKFGPSKKTETNLEGKEFTPYSEPRENLNIWQNGVSTIHFQESIGGLDACTTMFYLDRVYWNVDQLEAEKKAKQDESKK